jgi:hypothetical protein
MQYPVNREIPHFASNAPLILVYPNFSCNIDNILETATLNTDTIVFAKSRPVEYIALNIEKVLKARYAEGDLTFLSSGSSWSGMILNTSAHCIFKISLYKSRPNGTTNGTTYIIEGHRTEGDKYLFGNFFQKIRQQVFYPQFELLGTTKAKMDFLGDVGDVGDANSYFYSSTLASKIEFLIGVKSMIEDSYYKHALEGIQHLSDACTDRDMFGLIIKSDIMAFLVNIIKEIDMDEFAFENNWKWQYSLMSLLNLVKINCSEFIYAMVAANLFDPMYKKIEYIESRREPSRGYLLPPHQHLLNNGKQIFDKINKFFSEKRIDVLIFTRAVKKNTDVLRITSPTKSTKVLNRIHWIMHISGFI